MFIYPLFPQPCIIQTEEVFDTPDTVFIIMELMEGGELFDMISKCGKLSERSAKIVLRQMLLAVKYLHDQNITHRDLKVIISFSYYKYFSTILSLKIIYASA